MDSSTLVFIGIFFFISGAVVMGIIWALVNIGRGGKQKPKVSSSLDPNLEKIALLMRDTQTQELVVEMDGTYRKSVGELTPPQQRRLSFTSKVLSKWLSQPANTLEPAKMDDLLPADQPELAAPSETAVPAETPDQVEPVEMPVKAPEADPVDSNDWIPAESVPADPSAHHVPPFATESAPEVKPVSMKLPDMVTSILTPTPKTAPVFKSIAMQINDILQERIAHTPFETRGITVTDASDYGVTFTVDGEKYPSVKDIPDESVRNLIRSAVKEWEKQGKPESE